MHYTDFDRIADVKYLDRTAENFRLQYLLAR